MSPVKPAASRVVNSNSQYATKPTHAYDTPYAGAYLCVPSAILRLLTERRRRMSVCASAEYEASSTQDLLHDNDIHPLAIEHALFVIDTHGAEVMTLVQPHPSGVYGKSR